AAEYQPTGWQPLGGGALEPLESLAGKPVFAFCGLGRPDSFQRTLAGLGVNLCRFVPLRDHQVYDRPLLNRLGLDFLASRAEFLVTTAKDAVKLPPNFPLPVKILKMELALDRPGELAETVLRTARRGLSEES
ncbi:MAG: tetraacyldisaccharide 4'-kinase, partial [Candidatus Adiutrix sp.]|nr:tetraacyldisaccharide 4'-kinase [Candidatus Adiutrix sp.]